MNARAEQIYHAINAPFVGQEMPFIVTERIRKRSVMARTPSYFGIVLNEDLPFGFTGRAIIQKEHMYFFPGNVARGR
jgi:hypothetical protein